MPEDVDIPLLRRHTLLDFLHYQHSGNLYNESGHTNLGHKSFLPTLEGKKTAIMETCEENQEASVEERMMAMEIKGRRRRQRPTWRWMDCTMKEH
ncbi:hypothetical protein E2C01_022056 [Portunus trituberculatus]|uniref:Uncharacterized protein n=1 Tax=Portunus trituberculatus TaxID=210409 RepID=A0A5B7E693_PORTR|nr:hypothetical protein [Portunus trituberculatus]